MTLLNLPTHTQSDIIRLKTGMIRPTPANSLTPFLLPCTRTPNQSVFPAGPVFPKIPPKGPPFSSSQIAPLPALLLAFLPNTTATPQATIKPMDDNQGCLDHVVLILQKTWKKAEFEDLGVSEGGFLRVLGRVSRIEVRDGTMGFPVEV
jgi:hypothetical protein